MWKSPSIREFGVTANERKEVDKNFQKIHDHAVRMAEKVGCSPSKPRAAQRQQHCSNAPAESVVEYYKRNCATPFLDHILSSLDKTRQCIEGYQTM